MNDPKKDRNEPKGKPAADPVLPHTVHPSRQPAMPLKPKPEPEPPVKAKPKPASKPELTAEEKAAATAAYHDLKANLDEIDPEHPKTGIAGIFPAWLTLVLKRYGAELLALIEADLGIVPEPAPPPPPA